MGKQETDIQNQIRISLNPYAVTFRANVGLFYTKDGRPIQTGLPNGFPDLFGFRKSDGRMFFIEVKTKKGKRSDDQIKFGDAMQKYTQSCGVIYGVCRSTEDAITLICPEACEDRSY